MEKKDFANTMKLTFNSTATTYSTNKIFIPVILLLYYTEVFVSTMKLTFNSTEDTYSTNKIFLLQYSLMSANLILKAKEYLDKELQKYDNLKELHTDIFISMLFSDIKDEEYFSRLKNKGVGFN